MTQHTDRGAVDESALSASSLQHKAARGALWTLVHVVVSVPIAFLVNAIVARALGVNEYGELAFLLLAVNVLVSATNLGVSDGVVQWGAAAYARGDVDFVRLMLRRSLGYHVLVQLPIASMGVAIIARDQDLFVILCLVASVALPAVLGSAALTLTVENRSAGGAKVAIASNLLTQVVVAVTAALSQSAGGVWAARALLPSLLLPLNLFPLTREGRRNALRMLRPVLFPVGFWRYSLLSAAGGLIGMLVFQRSEIFVLRGFGMISAAGLFALAVGIAAQITAPVDALLGPLRPAVAGIVEAHPDRAASALLRITRVGSLVSGAIAVTAVPVLTVLLPGIYGADYAAAAPAFLVLGLMSCLQSVLGPLATFTSARRRAGLLLRLNLTALLVDVVIAFLAVPLVGIWGAVAASVAGQLTALVPLAVAECKAWGVGLRSYVSASACFVVGAGTAGTVVGALQAADVSGWGAAPAAVVLGMTALVVASRRSGGLDDQDVSSLLRTLPMRMQPAVRSAARTVLGSDKRV